MDHVSDGVYLSYAHGKFGRGGSQMGSPLNQILVEEIGKFDEPTPRYTTVQDVHRSGMSRGDSNVISPCSKTKTAKLFNHIHHPTS